MITIVLTSSMLQVTISLGEMRLVASGKFIVVIYETSCIYTVIQYYILYNINFVFVAPVTWLKLLYLVD